MYKTTELLDLVKDKYDLPSDYALAKKIGYTRSAVSKLRLKKSFLNTEGAYKVAQLLYLNPLKVVLYCEYERAEHYGDETMKKFWLDSLEGM